MIKNTIFFRQNDKKYVFKKITEFTTLIFSNFITIFNFSNIINTDYFETEAPHTKPMLGKERADEKGEFDI